MMSIEEISNELNSLAYRLDSMRNYQATTEGLKTTNALRKAADMLQSNHNEKLNAPLTLDELREMDGEPVFCVSAARPEDTAWGIVCIRGINPYVRTIKGGCSTFFYLTSYSSAWLAYRRKPEEEANEKPTHV